jgi:hypothetical protein
MAKRAGTAPRPGLARRAGSGALRLLVSVGERSQVESLMPSAVPRARVIVLFGGCWR